MRAPLYPLSYAAFVERTVGIEPTTASLEDWRSTAELRARNHEMEVCAGIEPAYEALQATASVHSASRPENCGACGRD